MPHDSIHHASCVGLGPHQLIDLGGEQVSKTLVGRSLGLLSQRECPSVPCHVGMYAVNRVVQPALRRSGSTVMKSQLACRTLAVVLSVLIASSFG